MLFATLRCISPCNKYLGDTIRQFNDLKALGYSQDEALQALGMKDGFQYCCRKTVLCHVNSLSEATDFLHHRLELEKHLFHPEQNAMPAYYGAYRDASTVYFDPTTMESHAHESSVCEFSAYDRHPYSAVVCASATGEEDLMEMNSGPAVVELALSSPAPRPAN